MAVSVFDLFIIGIGPSSSHTVGPMRAARQFALALEVSGDLHRVSGVRVHLYGSLAATGRGHGTHRALMLGLEGETAEEIDVDRLPGRIAAITGSRRLNLLARQGIPFDPDGDLVFERGGQLPGHPIRTMRDTGRDMQEKYKETSRGGLATHVAHVPVNVIEC